LSQGLPGGDILEPPHTKLWIQCQISPQIFSTCTYWVAGEKADEQAKDNT
jgi:hypothetical protein